MDATTPICQQVMSTDMMVALRLRGEATSVVELKACSTEGNSCLGMPSLKSVSHQVIGSRKTPSSVDLLSRHIVKPPSKCL